MDCKILTEDTGHDFARWPDKERITLSTLKQWQIEKYKAGTFSIKYVLEGTEHYYIQGKRFSVSGGNYLIVNANQPVDVLIDSRREVRCFCIHMTPQWMNEVNTAASSQAGALLDNPYHAISTGSFQEMIYSDQENALGLYLKEMAVRYQAGYLETGADPKDLYYDLASRALLLKYPGNTRDLKTVKHSTQQELLRRLSYAKEKIDAEFSSDLNLDDLAKEAMLSMPHLFSCFKKVYGTSPYQYLTGKRLEQAALLLSQENMQLSAIAESCGYADGASFSKAFRKKFGVTPTAYRTSK
ncbi:MAG TPA: AraC family transcriptional regulator [Flavisolibacter sp.]|jgi:AraC-like DNA-binding protein|nr:AraC family transcriptional regulator [Flavisolibacter sp.]